MEEEKKNTCENCGAELTEGKACNCGEEAAPAEAPAEAAPESPAESPAEEAPTEAPAADEAPATEENA